VEDRSLSGSDAPSCPRLPLRQILEILLELGRAHFGVLEFLALFLHYLGGSAGD
jgi:hypothetical protein